MDQAVSMAEIHRTPKKYGLHFDDHIVAKRGVTSFLVSDVSPDVTCHRNFNTRRVIRGVGNSSPSGAPECIPNI